MSLRDLQLQYEEDSDSKAAAERLEYLRASANLGNVDLPRAQRFIARAYSQVKQSLEAVAAVQTRGVGGKFKGWLRKVPPDVAAVLALRECIGRVTQKGGKSNEMPTVQLLAIQLGKLYELEVRIREAEAVNPLYMMRVHDQVKENCTKSQDHLRKLYNAAYGNVMKGELDSQLSQVELLQLGKFGVQAVIDAGIIVLSRSTNSKGNSATFSLAPEVLEFIYDYTAADVQSILNKETGAMMCEPDPWTNTKDGGYLSPRRKHGQPLINLASVRKSERARLRDTVYTAEAMPLVFQAANYLQSRRFAVHRPTLEAINRLWTSGGGVMGVPVKNPPERPRSPMAPEWLKEGALPDELETFTKWKRSVVRYYEAMREWRGKTREVGGFLKVARQVTPDIWFPVFMDKRGRWYYRGSPNPQGSDLSKAVLHFGQRKPLGERGLFWLKVHIANCYGFDKERFVKRAAWTDEHWGMIAAALDAPEDHADVWGTDAPWCMYSAAWELREALASGDPAAYESGVICHMDATCSGLQHFSAMQRDPVGGSYVNLSDDNPELCGPKQDIYSKVGTNALASIKLDSLDSDPAKAAIALWWLAAGGIPRNMAKPPVMTYCYGATLRSTVDFVQMYAEDEMGLKWPEGVRPYDYAAYAAKKLFLGIAQTVPAAEAIMQWLKGVAKQMPKGQRMEWTAPTGFKVQHDYQDYDEVTVKIRSCGLTEVVVREYNEDTKPLPMQNAVAPNFVHGLDASHFTFTALDMQRKGLDVVGIHDSYGTQMCDVDSMHESIRETFLKMYTEHNVLTSFLWEVDGIGEVPMRGTLDLTKVLSSEFFFC